MLRLSNLFVLALLAVACTSSTSNAEDDTNEAVGAATSGGAEGASCSSGSSGTANACASNLKCIDRKCVKECGSSDRCDSGSYCIPTSSYSSSGICSREAADEGEACFDRGSSCGSGLKCSNRECVKECSRYSSCGYKYCIPDSSFSSSGTCKSSKSNLSGPCFDDDSCSYGLKCKTGMCQFP